MENNETEKLTLPRAASLYDLHVKLEEMFEREGRDIWVKFIRSFDWEASLTQQGFTAEELTQILTIMDERLLFSAQITKLDEIDRLRRQRLRLVDPIERAATRRSFAAAARRFINDGAARLLNLISDAQKKK